MWVIWAFPHLLSFQGSTTSTNHARFRRILLLSVPSFVKRRIHRETQKEKQHEICTSTTGSYIEKDELKVANMSLSI